MIIETERLLIRNFRPEDAEALRAVIVEKEASEYAVYDHEWPTSLGAIRGIVEWFAQEDEFLAVCLKESGDLIGFLALSPSDDERAHEYNLGYCLHPAHHGRGYATEACRALLAHAFKRLRARRVVSGTAAANTPSVRLLERLGFRVVGESETSFRETPEGQPITFPGYAFALTQPEWQAASRGTT